MLTVHTPTTLEQAAITRISEDLRNLRIELISLFPEREWLIDQIMVALLSINDVLIYGEPGTGKSKLIRTVMKSIVGKGIDGEDVRHFSIKIDNETTLDKILGPMNLPHYEKHGEWIRTHRGYLPWANFAYIDEVFDGPAVLRGLNDVFNERELNEPPYVTPCPLYSGFGATNRSPKEIEAMLPFLNLKAFNDRWLFVSQVKPLQKPANQDQMIANHLNDVRVKSTIQFADIQTVARMVRSTNQFINLKFLQTYREIVTEYKAKTKAEVSDRRLNWLTQIIEAQAILQGNVVPFYEDIKSIAMGLCETSDCKEYEVFMKVATPIIDAAKVANNEHVDVVESAHLATIEAALKRLAAEAQKPKWPSSPADVGIAVTDISNWKKQLDALKPQLAINVNKRQDLMREADSLQQIIVAKA